MTAVAIVHDYLTQRGGAERVVLSMLKAFPGAPLYTSLYSADTTFAEFRAADVRPLPLNRIEPFRRNHRLAAPFLPAAFEGLSVDADVVICSSSGWAHAVRTSGRKVVYCHGPARWLYQTDRYLGPRRPLTRAILGAVAPALRHWDTQAARSAQRYLTQSTTVRERIQRLYGIEAELLPAPYTLGPGVGEPVDQVDSGFFLCVSRLLPYKNVDAVVAAFSRLPGYRLVVAGTGPEEKRLRGDAGRNVRFLGMVSDERLRWLYANCAGLIAASYEDYGLTPLEAAAHGKPTAALRWGGFLDTVIEDQTGIFFDTPNATAISGAVVRLAEKGFDPDAIRRHASAYAEEGFVGRLKTIVAAEAEQNVAHTWQPVLAEAG